ncbi:MAG TPA: hypothetical protein VL309_04815 [Vicinamibacterales bacterium]|nr:hypothetical protein [Vicinamibacterales bacterium]
MPEPLPPRLRGAAAAALGALVFLALVVPAYARFSTVLVTADRDLPRELTGFYPIERAGGLSFAWTRPHAGLALPAIDRRVPWRLAIRAKVWRPAGVPLPRVRLAADGIALVDRVMDGGESEVGATIPPRPGRRGVLVTIDTAPFVPGGEDTRALGLAVESVRLDAASGWPRLPFSALAPAALAVLLIGLLLAAIGLPAGWAFAGACTAALAECWGLTQGFAALGAYPLRLAAVAGAVGASTWAIAASVAALRRRPLSPLALGVAGLSALACYLKLLVLLHPGMAIGDGLFHAHRFEYVLNGRFYFTSIAPGNYAFPYPVLLYVVAAPFSLFAHDTLARVTLLRIIVTAADAVAGALLYWMIVRATGRRLPALGAVVWYHLIPMTAWIMTWGNLTNAFGQPLFVASLAAVVALPVEWTRPRTVGILAVVAAAALLSHPSTCAILTIVLGATAGLYAWHGDRRLRNAALGVAAATGAAAIAAFALYYAWFPAVYVRELGRAAAESGPRLAAANPGAPIGSRVISIPHLAGDYLGWPAMLAAAIGAWRLRWDVDNPRLVRLLAGWAGACVAFLLLGIVTPVQMRTYFAVFPVLAVGAAFGWTWAWRGRLPLRVAAVVVLAAAVWVGCRQWMAMLG